MADETKIKLFQNQEVRLKWDDEIEEYYFSVVDVVGILSESKNPNNYWKVLKNRLVKEGSEVVTKCNRLKLIAEDGKPRFTDVADMATRLRNVLAIAWFPEKRRNSHSRMNRSRDSNPI